MLLFYLTMVYIYVNSELVYAEVMLNTNKFGTKLHVIKFTRSARYLI